jgi:hypothetical protein
MTRLQLWEVETAAQQVAADVMREVPATVVAVAVWDQPSFTLTVKAVHTARRLPAMLAVGRRVPLARASWHRWVFERQEPVLLEEGSAERSLSPDEATLALVPGLRTVFLAPILVEGDLVGVLARGEMRAPAREPFTEERRRRCLAALDQAVSTSSRTWEVIRLRRQLRLSSSLLHIAREMLGAQSDEDVLAAIGSSIADWLGSSVRAILLQTSPGGRVRVAARWQFPEAVSEAAAHQLLLALARSDGPDRGSVRVVRVADDPLDPLHLASGNGGARTRISLPFVQADRLLGAVCLYVDDDLRPTSLEIGVFDWIAQITGVCMKLLGAVREHREERDWWKALASELLTTHQRTVVQEALTGVGPLVARALAERLDRAALGVAGDAAEEGDGRRRLAEAVIKQIDDALGELRRRADHGAFSGYGPVEVNDLVRRAIEIVQTRWTAGSQDPVRLEFQPLGEAMVVRASLALAGALAHAIDNAVEAAGQGGQVQVSTYRDDGHVVISVADSGPGIPEERREEAFAPFISTKSPPHIGLGLSVVRAWMLKHGGQVDLVPRGDGGTELVLRLPALREVDRTDLGA